MTDEPTIRELLIRLEGVTRSNESTIGRLDELVRSLEDKYVPRREFNLRVGELEKDNDKHSDFRRQVAAGFIVGFLLLLATVAATVARFPGVT
jgi:hypothetical protein